MGLSYARTSNRAIGNNAKLQEKSTPFLTGIQINGLRLELDVCRDDGGKKKLWGLQCMCVRVYRIYIYTVYIAKYKAREEKMGEIIK